MAEKFLPLNIRVKVIDPDQAKGRTTFMCAIPSPGNPGAVLANPGIIEIALIDPDDGKEKWYEVPFHTAEIPIIQVMPPRGKRN